MKSVSAAAVAAALLLLLAMDAASAAPFFDFFTGQRPRSYHPPQRRPPAPGSRSGRDRFKSICRTINADNYAFPGRVPYPSAPLCPF